VVPIRFAARTEHLIARARVGDLESITRFKGLLLLLLVIACPRTGVDRMDPLKTGGTSAVHSFGPDGTSQQVLRPDLIDGRWQEGLHQAESDSVCLLADLLLVSKPTIKPRPAWRSLWDFATP
jgi:hypothetical protein